METTQTNQSNQSQDHKYNFEYNLKNNLSCLWDTLYKSWLNTNTNIKELNT